MPVHKLAAHGFYTIFETEGSISTPFDMEAILQADAKLFEVWQACPFFLDLDENGQVIVRYIKVESGYAP